jgi:hypothetical protein
MLIRSDLDAPARPRSWPVAPDLWESAKGEDGRQSPTLREALREAMTQERAAGQAAHLRTASGIALKRNEIPYIWSSLQAISASNC